jgi:hypothetical protein
MDHFTLHGVRIGASRAVYNLSAILDNVVSGVYILSTH